MLFAELSAFALDNPFGPTGPVFYAAFFPFAALLALSFFAALTSLARFILLAIPVPARRPEFTGVPDVTATYSLSAFQNGGSRVM